jgi:hypothetical protein
MIVWISGSARTAEGLSRAAANRPGDLEARIPDVKTADEVGTLAGSLQNEEFPEAVHPGVEGDDRCRRGSKAN